MYKRFVVGTDGSKRAPDAVRTAGDLELPVEYHDSVSPRQGSQQCPSDETGEHR